jgi:hypothetical protein
MNTANQKMIQDRESQGWEGGLAPAQAEWRSRRAGVNHPSQPRGFQVRAFSFAIVIL